MNSRERILAAISHKEPDRVPVDLGATPSSGISAIAYSHVLKYLGMSGQTKIYDVVQQLAQPDEHILDYFGIDVVDLGRTFNVDADDWYNFAMSNGETAQYPRWFKPELNENGSYKAYSSDGTPIAMMPAGATFFDQTHFPYVDGYPENYNNLPAAMDKVLWAALVHSPWDNAIRPDFWEQLRERTLTLRKQTDRAIMIVCGCNLFEWGTFLRRLDNFLMDLMMETQKVEALLDALMEIHLSTLDKVCRAVGDVADIIRFGDDLGIDHGPFMAPEVYRSLFKPRHTELCDFVQKNSQMHTFLHSCGSIYQLMPDLIEAGFEIINPVQTNCADMEPEKLKKEFGKDITFWGGGIDTRHVLNKANPSEIKDHVKRRLDIFTPGGGFVFNTVHNILPDVPPQNIIAMYEAIAEYGK